MTLKQKTPLGLMEYELDDDALVLRQKKGSERLQTRIKYATLLQDPDHRASAERKFLYFAIFLGALAALFFAVSRNPDEVTRIFFNLLTFVTLVVTGVFIQKFRKSRFDVITYFYRNGAYAFNVWRDLPDEASCSEFLSQLNASIKKEHQEVREPGAPSLSSEIDRLGALRAKGFLTDDEFARAKASLLDQLERGGRVMGFHS